MNGKIFAGTSVGLLLAAAIIARTPGPASGISPGLVDQPRGSTQRARFESTYGKLPLSFEANRGQADAQVKFLARGRGYTLFLTSTDAVLSLRNPASKRAADRGHGFGRAGASHKPAFPPEAQTEQRMLQMHLVGSNPAARISGQEEQPGKVNYFLGNDPKKWRTNVPTYARVRYQEIYPAVDLVYYGNQRQLEYDFVVAPGGDPRAIQFDVAGAEKLAVDARGSLVLQAERGEVCFRKPVIYQSAEGGRREVAGRYVLRGQNRFGFQVAAYDTSKPLIIDPVLSYSTYLGGSTNSLGFGISAGLGIAVDGSGNAYVIGGTTSVDFPATAGGLQRNYGGGNDDAFVTKLSADGSTLLYSTFLGGFGDEVGSGIAVDSSGNAYLTGRTNSADFPTTAGAFQRTLGGGTCQVGFLSEPCFDAFVAKLSSTGSALVYSTLLGGNGEDDGIGIAVDASGNSYVVGQTAATNFPATTGAFQTAFGGGNFDTFIAKLKPDGSGLVYSTYLGGMGDDQGFGGIAVDASGNAYVAGRTSSQNFPTTSGAFQTAFGGGNSDGFVTKLKPDGSGLVFSTYLGGSASEANHGMGIAIDPSGSVFVTGDTSSTNFPTTAGAFQTSFSGGASDAFVTKLRADGSGLVYSSFLGGTGDDAAFCIAADSSGKAYVSGRTSSGNLPTAAAIQAAFAGGAHDGFVAGIKPDGTGLVFSSFLGGSGDDEANCIAVDGSGNVYLTGDTASSDFPLTPGAFQTTFGDGTNVAFVAKISPTDAPGVAFGPPSLDFGGQTVGIASAPLAARLLNAGSAALNLSGISVTGANAADFSESDNCGTSLAGGAECTIKVTFMPMAAGAATAAVTVSDNAAGNPQSLLLTGTGTLPAPIVSLSPSSLDFGIQAVGTTSTVQTVTVSNTGSATLNISSVAMTGSNSGEFALASGTTCTNGSSVAVGASCMINVTFTPTAAGNASAAVTVTDNAADSPEMISLSGATPPPDFSFGTPPQAQTITAGQTATFPLTLSGSNGFSGTVALSCSDPIPASSCSFSSTSVTLSGSTPATVSVSVSTTARSVLPPPVSRFRGPAVRVPVLWLLLASLALLASALRRRSHAHRHVWAGVAGLLLFAALSFGCGGGGSSTSGTPAGSFTVMVTGTGQGASHSTPLNVTVK